MPDTTESQGRADPSSALNKILDYTHKRFDTCSGRHLGREVRGSAWDRSNADGMDLMLEETRAGQWFLADFYQRAEYAQFKDVFDGTPGSTPTMHASRSLALARALEIVKALRPALPHDELLLLLNAVHLPESVAFPQEPGAVGQLMRLALTDRATFRTVSLQVFGERISAGQYRVESAAFFLDGKPTATVQVGSNWDGQMWRLYAWALGFLGHNVDLVGMSGGQRKRVPSEMKVGFGPSLIEVPMLALKTIEFPGVGPAYELLAKDCQAAKDRDPEHYGAMPGSYTPESVLQAWELAGWLFSCFSRVGPSSAAWQEDFPAMNQR